MKHFLFIASSCFVIASCGRPIETPTESAPSYTHVIPAPDTSRQQAEELWLVTKFCSQDSITANSCSIFFKQQDAPGKTFGLQASRNPLDNSLIVESGVLSQNEYQPTAIPDSCLKNEPSCIGYIPDLKERILFGQANYRFAAARAEASRRSLNEFSGALETSVDKVDKDLHDK
jgi:hypothetical protein